MLHSLFRLFHNAIRCLSTSATMWHIFNSVRAILSELQPLFVWQYLVVFWPCFLHFLHVWPCFFTVLALCYHFYIFLTLVILTMLHSLFRFTSVFTCLTMFFHCFGPLLPLFIFFLPWSFWPCCTHFSGFLHFWCVWPCFFTLLALCYHFLYFSYLGHFDHVALTCQVVSQCNQVLEHLCYHVAHIQVSTSNIKRVTATFCSAVLSSHFDHVFFTFYVSDHVFSLFWPSATTFYIFLTLVILTMLHSLFRFSSLFTCLTMFFHCFGPLLPLFIFFLPWSFWPCCTHFSGLLQFLRVWPCFFTLLALCYHFLYFSYLGHFDHVALTFQVFFTPCFFTVLALCYHFLYFSYLGHFDHVFTFQVFSFYMSDHVFSLFWPSATTFYIFLTLVILTMLHSLFRFSLFTCLTMFFHCFGPLLPLFIFFLPWSFWPCCTHFSGCFTMQSGAWAPLLPCGTYSSLYEQY